MSILGLAVLCDVLLVESGPVPRHRGSELHTVHLVPSKQQLQGGLSVVERVRVQLRPDL